MWNVLKLSIDGQMRHFIKTGGFITKCAHFNLKVPLFVEKRKNKFAHELKKNKFVFN
jgi:hypothetical protein